MKMLKKVKKPAGQIDTTTLNLTPDQEAQAIADTEAKKARMSPPGALGLPELLDKRRLEHGLVDEVFDIQPVFDRLFVYQLEADWQRGDTFSKEGVILKPEQAKVRGKREAPTGILVGGGQAALDVLRANGIELGHLVAFCRLSPWRMPIAMVNHQEVPVMMLRSGDLLGSYDLAESLREGRSRYELDEVSQQHVYVDESGRRWQPQAIVAGDQEE